MIKKLLIANRGEIACRIMRTATAMGMSTVAVYSEADARALHVRKADEAVCIGPAAAAESYLNSAAILDAAKKTGAEAIHPGYGFLAENADFAEAVGKAGLIFVGPPAQAIRSMGAKDNAKAIMAAANVPIVPGYYGADQSVSRLTEEAKNIGFPVLLKAALGGGGKGMRIVRKAGELAAAIDSAKREARSAFGDDRLLIERYLTDTRHVELQIFADRHGHAVHLFERDCSLQRRHQKVVEEAPAPGMSPELRRKMGAAAIAAAQAVGYEGAGTIEFLLAPDRQFYFMEMNTRLQVEHPVSELITGQDFVEWQLRIADGEPLPLAQSEISLRGHAVEVRLYAEDPDNNFLPAPGAIAHLKWPDDEPCLRIETGVEAGDVVSPHYDPMIAKVISYGETRGEAIAGLVGALNKIEITGPGQNLRFLMHLLTAKPFVEGTANTAFVDGLTPEAFALSEAQRTQILAAAARYRFAADDDLQAAQARKSADPHSPWADASGWRLGGSQRRRLQLILEKVAYQVFGSPEPDGYALEIDGRKIEPAGTDRPQVVKSPGHLHVFGCGGPAVVEVYDPLQAAASASLSGSSFAAPMPGKITVVNVVAGQQVIAGDVLVVLEAMKMEHAIVAPVDGVVEQLFVSLDEQVEEATELLAMETAK
ncbi:MAG: acetyl-CoA carboxylase biotin carboxylase subunit [Rhodospirillales bacterium]|nr:acetyl-CoA carboxylase biotin carboxylase subunit [Rhodospirillales bacterium]